MIIVIVAVFFAFGHPDSFERPVFYQVLLNQWVGVFPLLDPLVYNDVSAQVYPNPALASSYITVEANLGKVGELCPAILALPFLSGLYHVPEEDGWDSSWVELAWLVRQWAWYGVY